MKWNTIAMLVLTGSMLWKLYACVGPMDVYTAGVVFSEGEVVTTSNIEVFSQDSLSYFKTCDVASGEVGELFILGSVEGKPADPVQVDTAWVSGNVLSLVVSYGGGCRVHGFNLYTDGRTTTNIPGMIELHLTHDANGDVCKAMVTDTLTFNISGMCVCNGIELSIFTPGAESRYSPAPVWNQISGNKTRFCSYKFRSAYANNVMAYIGSYNGYKSTLSTTNKQLLIVFDSTQAVPTTSEKAAAVIAELQRMERMQVLSLRTGQLESIKEKLSKEQGQYWTIEDTVLPFNQWFDGAMVNGVRGVYSTLSCGSGVAFELPEKSIVNVAVKNNPASSGIKRHMPLQVSQSTTGITIDFAAADNPFRIRVSDIRGRVVAERSILPGQYRVTIANDGRTNLIPGCFCVSLISRGGDIRSKTVTVHWK